MEEKSLLFATKKETDDAIVALVDNDHRDLPMRCGFRLDFQRQVWITYDVHVAARARANNFVEIDKAVARERAQAAKYQPLRPLRKYKSRRGWRVK